MMASPIRGGDRALAFHRVQEARRELFEIRSGTFRLESAERARLVVWYEAKLARAELGLAQLSEGSAVASAARPTSP
jgi:hypothetical protein